MFSNKLKNSSILLLSLLIISCNNLRYKIAGSSGQEDDRVNITLDRDHTTPDMLSRNVQSGSNYNHAISRVDVEKYFSHADLSTLEITEGPDWLHYEFNRTENRAIFTGNIPTFESKELPKAIVVKGIIKDLDNLEHNWQFPLRIIKDTAPLIYTRDILVSLGSELNFKLTNDMISDLTQTEIDNEEYEITISAKPDWLVKIDKENFVGTIPHLGFNGSTISGTIYDSTGNESDWSFNLIAPTTTFVTEDHLTEVGSEFSYKIPLNVTPDLDLLVTNLPCWLGYHVDQTNKTINFNGTPTNEDLGDNIVAGTILNEYNVSFGWSFEIHVTKDIPPTISSLDVDVVNPSRNQNPTILVGLKGSNENTVVKLHSDPTCKTELETLALDDETEQVSIKVTTKLSEGTNLLYASASDLSDTISCSNEPLEYVVDLTAPVVSGLVIETLTQTNNDKNPILTVHFNDADIGSTVKIFDNRQCTSPITQVILNSLTNKTNIRLNDLSDGEHIFYASVVDFSGNESSCKKIPGPYRLDTVPPTISEVSLLNNTPSKDKTPTYRVTLLDNTGSHVKLFEDNTCNNEVGIESIGGITSTEVEVDQELNDGEHTIYARAFDSAQNASRCVASNNNYTVDNFEQKCSISGLYDSHTPTKIKTFTWSGCDEYRYVVTNSFTLDDPVIWSDWTKTSILQVDDLQDTEDVYYLHLQGRNIDELGNISEVTNSTASTHIDTRKPIIIGLTDANSPVNSQTWNFECDETNCVYRFQITDQPTTPTMTHRYSEVASVSKNCGQGIFYLHVQAKDLAGNESEVVTKKMVKEDNSNC